MNRSPFWISPVSFSMLNFRASADFILYCGSSTETCPLASISCVSRLTRTSSACSLVCCRLQCGTGFLCWAILAGNFLNGRSNLPEQIKGAGHQYDLVGSDAVEQ